MKESSIFHVWDSESEQVLESHNCFVDEGITAYENIANIEVHSKKETTSTSNHAVNLSSAFSFLLSQSSFVSEKVSASATLLLWFLLLQWSNSSSSFVSEEASTSSLSVWTHGFRLTSSRQVVWFRWAWFIEPFSLRWAWFIEPFSLSCIYATTFTVTQLLMSLTHISYAYAAISIDDIINHI
jgi:hypothetical protein